jgi:hypothetical protein
LDISYAKSGTGLKETGKVAKWTIASYNRFLGASMRGFSLTRKEAAQHYREMRSHLGRSVFRPDLSKHPRIAKREAEQAREKVKPPAETIAAWEEAYEDAAKFEDEEYGGGVDSPEA